ncbi:hypothetical protein [Desulfitobacterium sp.]|uniref:hypothetical protein n=1 Tax=Desulfitobacterium sp. TaxID=49981 RepID=UPI002CBA3F69|nr:hypothetical protein [Desulfitobacterium sp.]HVJ48685.1 hypothetical protein [Desulfitobacterium sp.]
MPSTQENVLEAWKSFISREIILEDKIRPEVARSWQRCRAQGLDPWSSSFPKSLDSVLTQVWRHKLPMQAGSGFQVSRNLCSP